MAEIYGHRWSSAYGDDPAGSAATTWAKGLAGLAPQQVADGIGSSIACADPWPPTLPEFRLRCLGIPTFAAVRADVARQDGFSRLVWQYLDGHRYRLASSDKADKLLGEAYEQAKEFVMRGGQLPAEPVAEITHEEREAKPASREEVQRHMHDIARELRISEPVEEGDQEAAA